MAVATSGEEVAILRGHTDWVTALAVLRDGQLASASADGTVRIWDLAKETEPVVLGGRPAVFSIEALAVLADGRFVSGSRNGTLRVWDWPASNEPAVLSSGPGCRSLAALADGRIACGADDGTIIIVDGRASADQIVLSAHSDSVDCGLAMSPYVDALCALADGRLASGSADGTVRVCSLAAPTEALVLRCVPFGKTGSVDAVVELLDGRVASGSSDGRVLIWNLAASAVSRVLLGDTDAERASVGATHGVEALAAMGAGRLAAGYSDGTTRIWDLAAMRDPMSLAGHGDRVTALAALGDARLAVASADGTVRIWDVSQTTSTPEALASAAATRPPTASLLRIAWPSTWAQAWALMIGTTTRYDFADIDALVQEQQSLIHGLDAVPLARANLSFAVVGVTSPSGYADVNQALHHVRMLALLHEGMPVEAFKGADFLYIHFADDPAAFGFLVCVLASGGLMAANMAG